MFLMLCGVLVTSLPLQKPVIGVYTTDGSAHNQTYIAASYVKWIEMAGGQVIPIKAYSSQQQLASSFKKMNGLLFTGGGMNFNFSNKWTHNAKFLFELAEAQNQRGQTFPIFGTCQGFQLFAYIVSVRAGQNDPLSHIQGQKSITRPVKLLGDLSQSFNGLDKQTRDKIQNQPGVYKYNHQFAILTQTFNKSKALSEYYDLSGVSYNTKQVQFTAVYTSKKYPFYAVQFHPEKNNFQFRAQVDRSKQGIIASQILANNFIEKARKSTHSYDSLQQLQNSLIINIQTVVPCNDSSFAQVYIFQQNHDFNTQQDPIQY